MTTLILWEMNETLLPTDPEERVKLTMSFLEIVKKDVDSGELKMYGVSPAVVRGFVVSEQDPKVIYSKAMMFCPYAKFEVIPILSVDEAIDELKGMQQ